MNDTQKNDITSTIKSRLEHVGYETRTLEDHFALVASNERRIVLLYFAVEATGNEITKAVNSQLSSLFFEKRFGLKTFDMYVVVICDSSLPIQESNIIENDARICRKVVIRSDAVSDQRLARSLAPLAPLELAPAIPTADTEVEKIFGDILKRNLGSNPLAKVLISAFDDHWDADRLLTEIKKGSDENNT